MSSDNQSLVRKARSGSAEAFGELYAGIAADLYRFAVYQTSNPTLAEDAVSECVLQAFQNIAQLKNAARFRSWMFSILLNCCRKQQKEKALALHRVPADDIDVAAPQTLPTDEALDLRAALQTLDEAEREILLLSVVGGYSSKEIGTMLSMRAGAVRTRLSRTRAKLMEAISK